MRGVKKEHLPSKDCVVCGRPFTWRKKWERCWDEVTTCSKSCNAKRRAAKRADKQADGEERSNDDGAAEANGTTASYAGSAGSEGPDTADVETDSRAAKRAHKKAVKAARRAAREGRQPDEEGQKECTLCGASKDLLIRCQVDASGTWHMACGGCWKDVSGGVVDGDEEHPHYRYGGLWKNRKAATKEKTPEGLPSA